MKKLLLLPAILSAPMALAQDDDVSLNELLELTVFSASKQKESINEVPVPVTVITAQMIERGGFQTLQDLLRTFVPGMTHSQDHNDSNVAMRGIYGSVQQKILVLFDGHRLNSRAYSEANPWHAISLDRLKQIEVLRGPASSLFGNVALTAVINLVPKEGSSIDGGMVSMTQGEYGLKALSGLIGKGEQDDFDLLIWSSVFESQGQRRPIAAADDYSENPRDGHAYIGAFRDPMSFDTGVKYKTNDFEVFLNARQGHYNEPFAGGGALTGQVYNYDDYDKLLGQGPGLTSSSGHIGITLKQDLSDSLKLNTLLYSDYSAIKGTIVTNPETKAAASAQWNDFDYGILSQITKSTGSGSIIAGIQAEQMTLNDSALFTAAAGEWSGILTADLIENGSESIYSGFVQVKHRFDHIIVNGGVRYDVKDRHRGEHKSATSPRLALIYLKDKTFDAKLSFARSFVDSPYWYRYNSLGSYQGSSGLKPEILEAIQASVGFHSKDGSLSNRLTLFSQELEDFLFRVPNPVDDEPRYISAGLLKSWGAEYEFSLTAESVQTQFNLAYHIAASAADYPVTDDQIHNIPTLTANLINNVQPLDSKNYNLHATVNYIGEQLSPLSTVKGDTAVNEPDNTVAATTLLHLGARADNIWKTVFLDLRLWNALDQEYYQGGSVKHPYPQAGRWFTAETGFKF